jgi:antitoxin VapB
MEQMALSIKSEAVEQLARKIASETGESLTRAIERALEERFEHLKQDRRRALLLEQLNEIVQRVDRLPVLDPRTPDEIVGYDENGLPSSPR